MLRGPEQIDVAHWAGRFGRRLLDLALPPQCLACGMLVAEPGRLCAACVAGIDLIGEPFCAVCGLPFEFETDAGQVCAACTALPPAFTRARSAARYGERIRDALLGFKHGDRTDRALGLARLMLRLGRPWLAEADLIVPVPLHPRRLLGRRYNQAALLANALAREVGRPAAPDLLVRKRPTRSQGGLSGTARRRNVGGAFRLHAAYAEAVRGAHVVIVDDVLTTGATVEACARTLRRAGAAETTVLTVARVVRTG